VLENNGIWGPILVAMSAEAAASVRYWTHSRMYQTLPMVLEEHKRDLNFCKWKIIEWILGMCWEITENDPLYTKFTQIQ
jgi:hypothetical protein